MSIDKQHTVAFFLRCFTERGTEVSAYNYAHYNEVILGNKSIFVCFQQVYENPQCPEAILKFSNRFPVIVIRDIFDMRAVIDHFGVTAFYTQTHGGPDWYNFENKELWKDVRTIKHAVFQTDFPESDRYCSISDMLNTKFGTDIPVVPYIVPKPTNIVDTLRDEFDIPRDAIVFGRIGADDQFDIPITHSAIAKHVEKNHNVYFFLMNTQKFTSDHPRIIHVDRTIDEDRKEKFINSCDAMIHARSGGETFGMAIAEFSIRNKPIITFNTTPGPQKDVEHIKILGDRAILYNTEAELLNIFENIKTIISTRDDWNAYNEFSPVNVMKLFKKTLLD
ncbi:hypothetical protein FK949_gp027 [Paramecium bursaria Chlorella virus NYs1]|uniref:Glycosyl transferase n=1 Tax=Paramecium bursaria Chlorella virus NYs1 TaxID=83442 RepID=M1I2Z7_9PHYC|nr:hypothetical protein FK949_gp027 [Paramecium bursaria Chlorella virus NYs1]AGE54133.1 hypothetical protein PBCVIL52s1_197R [Paramecium bursaria Chlorella virus IL-5-2s1]AGE54965.1 hypothetical protein PBCVMA1D_558R [Paramecium bursaria Chlorella virus MA1D]AGE58592.1 hypothetical protein PBCVNYs1_075L [Paramecium bursaria Chlorella virus NYs1]